VTSENFSDKMPLAAIVGPTASGKTKVAISVAKILQAEIISADSMLVYKHMDIGTAKPSTADRENIPHHLIDILEPWQEFSVAQYKKEALKVIDSMHIEERFPLMVGGTGLYINSVIYQMDFTDAGYDPELRLFLMEEFKRYGDHYLYEQLRRIDPTRAEKINPNDTKRVVRALEVYHLTGKPMSIYSQPDYLNEPKFNLAIFGLNMERSKLYQNIDKRVDQMLDNGFIEEVEKLKELGCSESMQSMQGLGYKQVFDYLKGRANISETIELIKRNTRRYAKRQLTWFRKDARICWINTDAFNSDEDIAKEIAQRLKDIFYF